MLIHKKRFEGSLNGIGYVNPYANDHLGPLDVQPLNYTDYINNIILQSDISTQSKLIAQQNELLQESGNTGEQTGSGIFEIGDTINKIYEGLKIASRIYSSGPVIAAKNYYGKNINPNPNFRPGFAGEKHMILQGTTASFLGPGTNIERRLARGDPPLDGSNGLDAQAKIHDIDYMRAKSLGDVRRADRKFIRNIEQSTGSRAMKTLAKGAIKGKMLAEDVGILDKNKYSQIDIASNKDTKLYGSGPPKLIKTRPMGKYPDSYIRSKIMKQYSKSKGRIHRIIN